ncbi:hypothetical protein LTR56_005293 [Elasticomyces elasticus]|nr:hypothetical protein LTR56_005293 [Elasticomyces elasticus]KAK4923669.1 hypothetical protein LTR49_009224 [Elasticomyces elasticus]
MLRRLRARLRHNPTQKVASNTPEPDQELLESIFVVLKRQYADKPASVVREAAEKAAKVAVASLKNQSDWNPQKPETIEDRLEKCIRSLLHEEYPYTKSSMINEVASICAPYTVARILREKRRDHTGCRDIQFLDLPSELRNMIYELTVTTADQRVLYTGHIHSWCDLVPYGLKPAHPWKIYPTGLDAHQPPITRVSRQLRNETLGMFYAANTFAIVLPGYGWPTARRSVDVFLRWAKAIGADNRRAITKLYIYPYWQAKTFDQIMQEANLQWAEGIIRELHR